MLYIESGSPWENGSIESFSGKLRSECQKGEIYYSLKDDRIVIEGWRMEYNTRNPHSSLGYWPPASQALMPTRLPGHGKWKRYAFHTSPYPGSGEGRQIKKDATLTNHLFQNRGQVKSAS